MSWRMVFTILMSLWLISCATKPSEIVVYSLEQRRVAMEYALTQNLVLQALVDECSPIDDKTRVFAEQAQQQWWQRNWPIVAAADAEMTTQTQQQQARLGDITGQLLLIRFIYQAEQRSVDRIKADIKKSTRREHACQLYLAPYAKGAEDLQTSEHAGVLAILAKDYPQAISSSPHSVPQVVNGFKAARNTGQSSYQVEQTARQNLCPVPEVLNIFNRWPREMYGAYCDAKDPRLIVCEWSECTVISGQ